MKIRLKLTPRTVNELGKVKKLIYRSFFVDCFSRNGELKFGNDDYEDSKNVIGKRVCVSGLEIGSGKFESLSSSVVFRTS